MTRLHLNSDNGTSTADQAPRIVSCPACDGDSVFGPANRYRPFCSLRCKSMDLGAWASESFRMPAETAPDDVSFNAPRTQ